MNRCWDVPGLIKVLVLLLATAISLGAQLPPSRGTPRVGEKAPDFTLTDTTGKPVKLFELLAAPAPQQSGSSAAAAQQPKPQGVLLIFYRGYW